MERQHSLWLIFEKSGKLTDYISFCEERRRAQNRREAPGPNDSGDDDQSSL